MKRGFRVVLFGGVVALMGLMIRSCNKQLGWYEANKIKLEVEKPLQESKFRWYQAEPFTLDAVDRVILPLQYAQLLYDTALVKPFPRIQDNNYFVLVYDSTWVFPFDHYKLRANTQHTYRFHLFLQDSIPYAEIDIDGPHSSYFSGPFISLMDSSAYLPQTEPNYPEDQDDPDAPMEAIGSDPSSTTDYESR